MLTTYHPSAFNAWITDTVPSQSRGRAESVLAILPLISMLVIFGLFDGMTQRGQWQKFFAIFGGLVVLTGIASVFLIPEPKLTPRRDSYLKTLVYGLRPSVVRENPALYLSFAAFCLFSVAVQVFFPYLIIYMQNYLHFDGYALVLGIVLIFASVVSVLSGRVIDRLGELRCVLPAAGIMFAGLLGMFFARSMLAVILTGCVMMSGYMLVTAILSGVIRDHTPAGKAGHFQGIRMIFGVLLPMILGPAIGAAVIRGSDSTYVDLGVVKTVPTPSIFLAAAIVLLLILAVLLLFTYVYPVVIHYDAAVDPYINLMDSTAKHLGPKAAMAKFGNNIHWIFGSGSAGQSTFDAVWYGSSISVSVMGVPRHREARLYSRSRMMMTWVRIK